MSEPAQNSLIIETGRLRAERMTLTKDRRGLAIMPTPVIRITITEGDFSLSFDLQPNDAVDFAYSLFKIARGDKLVSTVAALA